MTLIAKIPALEQGIMIFPIESGESMTNLAAR